MERKERGTDTNITRKMLYHNPKISGTETNITREMLYRVFHK